MPIDQPLTAETEDRAEYTVPSVPSTTADEDAIIERAKAILVSRLKQYGVALTSPASVKDFLKLQLADLEHETFGCLFLNAQNQLIAYEEMFRGTLVQTNVYPREVVKASLAHNAAGVVFAHNHPSGSDEPSRADELLTNQLKTALAMVDVRVLDHLIITQDKTLSFAERGLI